MSESVPPTLDGLPPIDHDSRVYHALIDDYQFLQRHFPRAVTQHVLPYEHDGRQGYEYLFTVGEPMRAEDVFGVGRSLEVGGPSDYSSLRSVKGAVRPTIVTNIDKHPKPGVEVDEIVDAGRMHYPSQSLHTILAMALPGLQREQADEQKTLRPDFLREAHRVLEPGGFLLMSAASKADVEDALSLGFTLEQGNGCIVARMAALEENPQPEVMTHMEFEILLHA